MANVHSRCVIMVALACSAALPIWANDMPLLSASTESSSSAETRPSAQLVRIVLKSVDKDDVEELDRCLTEEGSKGADYASLLRAVKISAGADRTLWFIRPALKPYCHALYGAHLFRYFLIEEQLSTSEPHYHLLYRNGGDAFTIYPQQSRGLNDIEATGCIATECRSRRMAFDGRGYRPVRCTRTTSGASGKEVTEQRRCGSDDGKDDQSSGLEAQQGR